MTSDAEQPGDLGYFPLVFEVAGSRFAAASVAAVTMARKFVARRILNERGRKNGWADARNGVGGERTSLSNERCFSYADGRLVRTGEGPAKTDLQTDV